ncbi:pilus assembly protein PilP [Legionella brunensis]|uniref:Tfp pilus assembly protein PilP n=1 Tax=Legionella brunensis TaxID=29422 RepID=A0A0W0SL57_9GAMM|nr:pilus assembly protein PilP [Legionella brunensis]KTC84146.1 Tfp pilus assembly protein PilP [Legionella brunensis]
MIQRNWLVVLGFSMLISCGNSTNDDLKVYIKTIKDRAIPYQEEISLIKPVMNFDYPQGNQRRDPFKLISRENRKIRKSSSNHLLTEFSMNSLKFVGLIRNFSMTWALIKVPNGKIIHVKKGDYVGQNNMRLLKINENDLLFEEQNFVNGKWRKKGVKVFLSQGKGVKFA